MQPEPLEVHLLMIILISDSLGRLLGGYFWKLLIIAPGGPRGRKNKNQLAGRSITLMDERFKNTRNRRGEEIRHRGTLFAEFGVCENFRNFDWID